MRRNAIGEYAFTAFAALVALLVLMPLLWMVSVSLMHPGAAAQFPPPLLPEQPTLDNYRTLFQDYGIDRYAFNSLLVSVLATFLALRTLALEGPEGHAALREQVRRFAAPRYQEGYQKGIHDEDATRLLAALIAMQDEAGLLAYGRAAGDGLGWGVRVADLNGDDIDDLIVAAPEADVGSPVRAKAGAVYIWLGIAGMTGVRDAAAVDVISRRQNEVIISNLQKDA